MQKRAINDKFNVQKEIATNFTRNTILKSAQVLKYRLKLVLVKQYGARVGFLIIFLS